VAFGKWSSAGYPPTGSLRCDMCDLWQDATPLVFRTARLPHGLPQFVGDGGHTLVAGMASDSLMFNLTLRAGRIRRIGS